MCNSAASVWCLLSKIHTDQSRVKKMTTLCESVGPIWSVQFWQRQKLQLNQRACWSLMVDASAPCNYLHGARYSRRARPSSDMCSQTMALVLSSPERHSMRLTCGETTFCTQRNVWWTIKIHWKTKDVPCVHSTVTVRLLSFLLFFLLPSLSFLLLKTKRVVMPDLTVLHQQYPDRGI